MPAPPSEEPVGSSDELQLPDLLLAAAFSRRSTEGGKSSITEVRSGLELGDYRILHRIGSGGMGTVYAAEQKSPRRRVALKLLSPSSASKAMVRRFQQEARLLGNLQHAGLAQVYGAGAVEIEGLAIPLHYLAMELIEGPPLDLWARERGLDVSARLELLARVCDAVQHAHQRGVIHRDLKPGNVLVVSDERGGPGQPKVLDFGVARALDGSLTPDHDERERSQVTQAGQVVGTLAYMSPEQADSDEVDTRSDVYALGVILYRLLCDAPPVDVSGQGVVEAARRIREEQPRRPSERVPGLDSELDTITLKALSKSRAERYGSAAELAADLRRHLRGEPILAREHSALYVLRKAIARNRGLAVAALALVLLLAVFALVSGLQSARNRTLAASDREARNQLAVELRRSNLDRGRLFAMAGNLSAAEDLLWSELARAPDSDEVLWGLRDLYRRYPVRASWSTPARVLWSLLALPDGRLVSLGNDGVLREHRPPAFEPRETGFRGEAGLQRLLATPDGQRLVRLGGAGRVDVIAAASLERLFSLAVGDPAIASGEGNALELPSDEHALIGLRDGRLLEIELRPDARAREVWRHERPLSDLRLAPDRRRLAIGDDTGDVRLLDLELGRVLWVAPGFGMDVARMEFDPAGERLHAGGQDRCVRVLRVSDGAQLDVWRAPNGSIRQIEIDAERGRALVGGWWSLDEWSLADGVRRVRVPLPADCFRRPLDSNLLAVSGGGGLRLWDAAALEQHPNLAQASERTCALYLGAGKLVAVGDSQGSLSLVEGGSGRVLWSTVALDRRIRALSSTPDGKHLLAGGEGSDAIVAEVQSGRINERFGPVWAMTRNALAVHPDGQRLAYCEAPEVVVVRDLQSGQIRARIEGLHGVNGICWLPDGERLALVERTRSLRLFDADGTALAECEAPEDLWTLCASPDGRTLAVSAWGGDVFLFDAGTLELRGRLTGHFTTVWDLDFLGRDSGCLLSAAGDGTVRLWDLAERRALLVLDELQGWEALTVQAEPSGRRVLLAASNGIVREVSLYAADRSIGGNLEYQLERQRERGAGKLDTALVAARVRAALELSER